MSSHMIVVIFFFDSWTSISSILSQHGFYPHFFLIYILLPTQRALRIIHLIECYLESPFGQSISSHTLTLGYQTLSPLRHMMRIQVTTKWEFTCASIFVKWCPSMIHLRSLRVGIHMCIYLHEVMLDPNINPS